MLSHLSRIILTGIESNYQEICDGIRGLSNMSFVSYPKNRILQIILDPRIIAKDANVFVSKCSNVKFLEVRHQIIQDLEKILNEKEVIFVLKKIVSNLLDNNENLHIHNKNENCLLQNETLPSLYEKCITLGLPYGYLNLYPSTLLSRLSKENNLVGRTILKNVNSISEFKTMMRICSTDYRRAYSIAKIFDLVEDECSLHYLLDLPVQVIEVLSYAVHKHKNFNINKCKIEKILELFRTDFDLFAILEQKPRIIQTFLSEDNNDIAVDILKFFHESDKKIDNIKTVQSMLLDFISNSDFKITNNEIKSLMNLCEVDIGKAIKVCANFCRIKKMNLEISLFCSLAIKKPEKFDELFEKLCHNIKHIEKPKIAKKNKDFSKVIQKNKYVILR
jgi:hypothetical protein